MSSASVSVRPAMAANGKSERLAVLLASGRSIKDAAAEIGCGTRTAYRHASTPRVRQRVAELRSAITAEAVGRLTTAATTAVDTLTELLDGDFEPSVRLQAAKSILASLGPISELSELRQRLDELEQGRR